jgi:hypothetical protein
MSRHRRHFFALSLALAVLVGGLSMGLPTSARADDFCAYEDSTPPAITGFGPSTVTLGLNPKMVEFSVQANDECGTAGWSIDTPDRFLFFVYKESAKDAVYPFRNKYAGPTAADVWVHDQAYNLQKGRFTFRLLRQTRWQSVKVRPAPVKKGDRLTIKGSLQRADWNKKAYVRFGGSTHRATVQFRAQGSDTWIPVKTVGFASTGRISTQVTVKREVAQDGWYRLHFAGTPTSGASASSPEFVVVQ